MSLFSRAIGDGVREGVERGIEEGFRLAQPKVDAILEPLKQSIARDKAEIVRLRARVAELEAAGGASERPEERYGNPRIAREQAR